MKTLKNLVNDKQLVDLIILRNQLGVQLICLQFRVESICTMLVKKLNAVCYAVSEELCLIQSPFILIVFNSVLSRRLEQGLESRQISRDRGGKEGSR